MGHFCAYTASMAFHQVLLQSTQFIGRNITVAQAAESCRDAIERDIGFLDLFVQVIPAFLNPVFGFRSQFQFQIFIDNTFDDVKSEVTRTYLIYILHGLILFLTAEVGIKKWFSHSPVFSVLRQWSSVLSYRPLRSSL